MTERERGYMNIFWVSLLLCVDSVP